MLTAFDFGFHNFSHNSILTTIGVAVLCRAGLFVYCLKIETWLNMKHVLFCAAGFRLKQIGSEGCLALLLNL